jgi:AmiR/NasT family two-component response regulator
VPYGGSAAEGQFETALSTRDEVGRAKSVLMNRAGVDADMTFRMVIKISQDTNTRIDDLARRLLPSTLAQSATLSNGRQ